MRSWVLLSIITTRANALAESLNFPFTTSFPESFPFGLNHSGTPKGCLSPYSSRICACSAQSCLRILPGMYSIASFTASLISSSIFEI